MFYFWVNVRQLLLSSIVYAGGKEGFDVLDTDNNDLLQIRDFGKITPDQREKLTHLFQTIGVDITKLSNRTGFTKESIENRITDDFILQYDTIVSAAKERRSILSGDTGKTGNTENQPGGESSEIISGKINYPPRTKAEAKSIQVMLQKSGHYTMQIDGKFGKGSKEALQGFLRDKGLYHGPIDGKIGDLSSGAIYAFNAGKKGRAQNTKVETQANVNSLSQNQAKIAGEWIQKNLSKPEIQELAKKLKLRKGQSYIDLARKVAEFQDTQVELVTDGKPGEQTLKTLGIRKPTAFKSEIDTSNSNESSEGLHRSNKEFMRKYVPKKWRKQFLKFALTLKPKEILSSKNAITLCDSKTNKTLFVFNGETEEMIVGFGLNGFSDGYVGTNDKKTPRGIVTRFTSVNKPADLYGDASNTGSKTLKGAALMGDDTITTKRVRLKNGKMGHIQTGKWHHGVVDRRVGKNDSNGCVTYSVHDIRKIATAIKKSNHKGYGFVS